MSQTLIGVTVAAANGSDATIYTVPAGYVAMIDGIIATNTTGGGLTITFKIGNRVGTTYNIATAVSVGANTAVSFNKGTTTALTTLVLNAGETFLGNGSGSGINVTLSGLLQSLS